MRRARCPPRTRRGISGSLPSGIRRRFDPREPPLRGGRLQSPRRGASLAWRDGTGQGLDDLGVLHQHDVVAQAVAVAPQGLVRIVVLVPPGRARVYAIPRQQGRYVVTLERPEGL